MKKAKLLLLLVLISASASTVYGQAFKKGTNVISAGIGLGSHFTYYSIDSRTPTINFQYEKGLWKVGPGVIALGGYVGFTSYKHYYNGNVRSNNTILGVRGAYHYTDWPSDNEALKKLDVYAGLMISYSIADEYALYGDYPNVSVSPYAGARYFFTTNFGAFAEVGYGISYLNIGVCLKF